MEPHTTPAKSYIRWMIRRDMPEVLAIEAASFDHGWTEENFLAALRRRNCIGMVVEDRDRVVGFMVYELHADRLKLLNLAVAPADRRRGVGRQMVAKLTDKIGRQHRVAVGAEVRETNLDALLFFRQCGFLATGTDRAGYRDTGEDAVRMEYRLGWRNAGRVRVRPAD